MKNYLIQRKKRYFWPGGELTGSNPNGINWNNQLGNPIASAYQMPTSPASNAPKLTIDPMQKPDNPVSTVDPAKQTASAPKGAGFAKGMGMATEMLGKGMDILTREGTGDHTKDNLGKVGDLSNMIAEKTGPYGQVANAAIQGFVGGATNYDKGKADTEINKMKETEKQANNVTQTYTAGQNQLNTIKKTGTAYNQKQLKTGKGWKNVLGAAASGAMAGAAIGGPWGALIGGAVGALGAGIGSIFGRKKRDKLANQMAEAKKNEDFSVDYYNSRQAEQLASANDNAAKVQADQNRLSVLALAARGGRLNRKKNYLIDRRNKLC